MSGTRTSLVLMAVGLSFATLALAEEVSTPLSPQFQRETQELKQRQSQTSQGLKLDAAERLDLYNLEMRQQREQQQLQERQRQQFQAQERHDTATGAGRLNQQHILQRQREQQLRHFSRQLEQWRAQQQPGH